MFIIKCFLHTISANGNNALDTVWDMFIYQGISDRFCPPDFSTWVKTLASYIDCNQNIRDSPQDEPRIRDGYQHEQAGKEGHKCHGRCQVSGKKVIHNGNVLGESVLNSSIWIGIKKADGCMQDRFQHLVMEMLAGVCSDPKEVKRSEESKDHGCTSQDS